MFKWQNCNVNAANELNSKKRGCLGVRFLSFAVMVGSSILVGSFCCLFFLMLNMLSNLTRLDTKHADNSNIVVINIIAVHFIDILLTFLV